MFHPEVLFDWGEKSMHAFLDDKNEKLRRFCDPNVIDRTLIIEYAYKYGERLQNKINTYRNLIIDGNEYEKIDTLIEEIKCEKNEENLRIVRDWLIYALHTMGERDFAKITSCISCSEGEQRYNVANRFGKGRFNSNYYVIMDSWVRCEEEGRVFKSVNYINTVLEKYGLKWFPNRNNEIMLKYAIFPQRLVGYYLIDRGNIGKYVIKDCMGRMRFREMTDPLVQFTRWYIITDRGGFDNVYASFPSGHTMNSAAVILLTMLPTFLPELKVRENLLKGIAYVWIIVVGCSRVVMGAHFASDVTVGALISLALFDIISNLVKRQRKSH